ncbi:uncharacterized protein LOC105762021 [Gossypium raimondii]|uniref:uncharacterized protein LOC105762021 n=1 Tax=Gossypium raimondii TaxID=29730 RepID=UPI00063AC5B0|nr:uncharacterized protein LOC105762021 [Gossypium raimondii]
MVDKSEKEKELAIDRGRLIRLCVPEETSSRKRKHRGQSSCGDPKGKQKVRGTIHVIVGMDEDWESSNAKRKAHMRCSIMRTAKMVAREPATRGQSSQRTELASQALDLDSLDARDERECLKANSDDFAWSAVDMPGINPQEVDKLFSTSFIREVVYPDWVSNVVMVKKVNEKWRICIDFTNLNNACPKENFPLPSIDCLVDASAGHKFMSFIDAFSSYNQILLDQGDQERTTFITKEGLFCY